MSNALQRGRTLNPDAVKKARQWRENRLKELNAKIGSEGILSLSRRELHEWRRLSGKLAP